MRSVWPIVLGIVLGLAMAGSVGADPATTVALENQHDQAARAATLAWWLGVQDYPHADLDTVRADQSGAYAEIGERSIRAISRVLDTTGEGAVWVAFNPFAFPISAARIDSALASADPRPGATGPPPIGVSVHPSPVAPAEQPNQRSSTDELIFATSDSSVQDQRRQIAAMLAPIVIQIDEPAEGPWGRSVGFLKLGTVQGPGHPQVDVERVYKSPRGDWVVVRLINQSNAPAEHVVVAPIAPIRAWQELGSDDEQIVAGDDVDLQGGALICRIAAGARRAFALALAPPPPFRAASPSPDCRLSDPRIGPREQP